MTEQYTKSTIPFECSIDGCDYTTEREYDSEFERDRLAHEHDAAIHYEREHAGRVRVKVVLETEQLLGERDPLDVADYHFDRWDDRDNLGGFEVAYTVAEVVEESDVGVDA